MRKGVKDIVWSLSGQVLPMVAGVVSIPIILKRLGSDEFGILSLIWGLIAYLALFDLGVSRALTREVSRRRELQADTTLGSLTSAGILLVGTVSCLLGGIMVIAAPWIAKTFIHAPRPLESAATASCVYLGICIPLTLIANAYRGILEGLHRFKLTNAIRVPTGVSLFVLPALVALAGGGLTPVVQAIVVSRLGSLVAFAIAAHRSVSMSLFGNDLGTLQRETRTLLEFGGWLAASNLVSPVFNYGERLILSPLISLTAVTYYSTAYELATKVWLFPTAVTSVLFPRLTAAFAARGSGIGELYRQHVALVFLLSFPPLAILSFASAPILTLWLGEAVGRGASPLMPWLCSAVLLNSCAQVSSCVIQASGYVRWKMYIHLWEIVPFAIVIWLSVRAFGVEGAAISFFIRMVLDTILFFVMAKRSILASALQPPSHLLLIPMIGAALLLLSRLPMATTVASTLGLGTIAVASVLGLRLTGRTPRQLIHLLKPAR